MPQKDESNQIAKEAITLSLSNYLCRVIYLVRGLGVAALLQPEIYGIWSVLKSLQDSTAFSGLGSSFALLRETAVKREQNDQAGMRQIQTTALNLAIGVTVIITAVLLVLSFTPLMPDIGPLLRISLLVMLLSSITYYIPRELLARTEFYFQARYLLVYALANTLLSLIAVYFWGLAEMLWGLVIAHLLSIWYVVHHGQLNWTPEFDSALARRLVREGLPVMVGAGLFFFLRSVDQFLIYAMIGSAAAGYYAISIFVAMTVTQIPVALASTLFPRMMERQSQGASRQDIEHLFFVPLEALCIATPVLLGATYFAIEPMLVYLLAEYLPALNVIRIALIGIFFQSIWALAHSLLLTFDKQREQMRIGLALLAINILVVVGTIKLGGGVEAVTWAASTVSLLSALVILFYIFRLLERPIASNIKTLTNIVWPLLYGSAACLLIDNYLEFGFEGSFASALEAIVKLSVFGLASIPLIVLVWQAWKNRAKPETAA